MHVHPWKPPGSPRGGPGFRAWSREHRAQMTNEKPERFFRTARSPSGGPASVRTTGRPRRLTGFLISLLEASEAEPARAPAQAELLLLRHEGGRGLLERPRRIRPGEEVDVDPPHPAVAELDVAGPQPVIA